MFLAPGPMGPRASHTGDVGSVMRRRFRRKGRPSVGAARRLRVGAALAVGLASAWAGAWPEPSLPPHSREVAASDDQRIVTHEAWARALVERLGLSSALGAAGGSAEAFELLAPATRPLAGAPSGGAGQVPSDGAVRLPVTVPGAGSYALVVHGRGPARWQVEGRSLGLLDPTALGTSHSRRVVPLVAGSHALVAYPAAGARIEGASLELPAGGVVAPQGGWQHGAALSFGDKARTLVQALRLEGLLPADGAPTPLQVGGAGAPEGPVELSFPLVAAAGGVVSLLARVTGEDPALWWIDDRPVREPVAASASAWMEVATLPLEAGDHRVRVRLASGARLDALQSLPRASRDADYVAVLVGLGLEEGHPEAAVTAADAERNLESDLVRALFADPAHGSQPALAALEQELDRFYTRPLSPVLPTER